MNEKAAAKLDWLNFFLADVRDGLGPYLAIYLLTVWHWDEATIGVVLTVAGVAAILTQTPAGALIDAVKSTRAIIVVAAIAITIASLAMPLFPQFWAIAALQSVSGAAGAVFPPAMAALTLGIVGPRAFARRIGRNEAFNHAGNATAATIAGGTAYLFGPIAVFWLMAGMAVLSVVATFAIPADAVDHDQARGLQEGEGDDGKREQPSAWRALVTSRPLLIFAACTTLFHFANAAMLPLVGQELALGAGKEFGTTLMSVCIVAAQLVMVPVAMIVGAKTDDWGRKPIFLVGFAVLTLRGILYPVSDDPYWLVGVQLLDGVGAGIFGALFPLVVADITRGTGRFNVSQGAVATAQGVGAALSTTAAGFIVTIWGYGPAFLFLAVVAGSGLLLFALAMPETRVPSTSSPQSSQAPLTGR